MIFKAATSEAEACPTTLELRGVTYTVVSTSEEITGAADQGVGTEHGCGDAGPWSLGVSVWSIADVDPRTALVTPVAAHTLYLADGTSIDELPPKIAELIVQD